MGKYAIVSGGFDPIHKGHIRLIEEANKIGTDGVIVILNSDEWLRERKHVPLLDYESRLDLVSHLKGVVWVIYDSYESDVRDGTVCAALRRIKKTYTDDKLFFCNGGDRNRTADVPEHKVCHNLGIVSKFGVGGRDKKASSSAILSSYVKSCRGKTVAADETPLTGTQQKIVDVLEGMKHLLLYKNTKYGDSAINPKKTWYKGDSKNSILVRLNDKQARIENNPDPEPRVNDVADMIGYEVLLLISMGVTSDDLKKFED